MNKPHLVFKHSRWGVHRSRVYWDLPVSTGVTVLSAFDRYRRYIK